MFSKYQLPDHVYSLCYSCNKEDLAVCAERVRGVEITLEVPVCNHCRRAQFFSEAGLELMPSKTCTVYVPLTTFLDLQKTVATASPKTVCPAIVARIGAIPGDDMKTKQYKSALNVVLPTALCALQAKETCSAIPSWMVGTAASLATSSVFAGVDLSVFGSAPWEMPWEWTAATSAVSSYVGYKASVDWSVFLEYTAHKRFTNEPDEDAPPSGMANPEMLAPTPLLEGEELPSIDHPLGRDLSMAYRSEQVESVLLDEKVLESTGVSKATLVGPDLIPVSHYSNTFANGNAVVAGRMLGSRKPFRPSPRVRQNINDIVQFLKDEVFTTKAIDEWCADKTLLSEIKSKKWTYERLERGIDELAGTAPDDVRQKWSAQIKDEILPISYKKMRYPKMKEDGTWDIDPNSDEVLLPKAPRLVVDCGTAGQLMALPTIACIEDIIFTKYARHSIKHQSKLDAIQRIFKELAGPDVPMRGKLMEGDGSAWDMTVSPALQEMLENEIIDHVGEIMYRDGMACETLGLWAEADRKDRHRKKRNHLFLKGESVGKFVTAAFRASGDRGTSVLNWLVNAVLWVAILFTDTKALPAGDPTSPFRHPEYDFHYDPNGIVRMGKGRKPAIRFKWYMEGDDSVLAYISALTTLQIEKEWSLCGFNMKLKELEAGQIVTFCGMQALVNQDFTLGPPIPEVRRNIAAASWTLSKSADPLSIAGACAARVQMFQNCPYLASYFQKIGYHWIAQVDLAEVATEIVLDKDAQFRLYGDYDSMRGTRVDHLLELDPAIDAMAGLDFIKADTGIDISAGDVAAMFAIPSLGPGDTFVAHYLPKKYVGGSA